MPDGRTETRTEVRAHRGRAWAAPPSRRPCEPAWPTERFTARHFLVLGSLKGVETEVFCLLGALVVTLLMNPTFEQKGKNA